MELNDLFVSFKQTDPVHFQFEKPVLPRQIYANLDRARSAVAGTDAPAEEETVPEETSDMSTWAVYGINPEETSTNSNQGDVSQTRTPRQSSSTSTQSDGNASFSSTAKIGDPALAKYWMDKFAKYGVSPAHQVAIVAAMHGECGLKPRGAVEKKELAGKGNTKAGWAHAGEGAVGFTHWSLKKRMIELYNAHPDRKGPPLSTVESEYAKPGSRHIVDLDDDDHALMTYLFYKDRLDATKDYSFDDIIADFYLQKAGRGFGERKGAGSTPYEKAMYTAKVYQQSHAKLGYHNAAKVNTFLKSLNFAKGLAKEVGYSA